MRQRIDGSPNPAPRPGRSAAALLHPILLVASGAALVAVLAGAAPPLYPRTPAEIRFSLDASPHAGDCETCHELHGESLPSPSARLLRGPDDNSFCVPCHNTPWAGGSYADLLTYAGSAHGAGSTMVWPGPDPPGRTEADAAGKCLNCHDPHGWPDAGGQIPHLELAREENLCFTCHDGSPAATNIRVEMQKPFRHPAIDYSGRHTGPTESLPEDFAITPVNRRHAECEDCHNPHVGRHDRVAVAAPDASKLILGASRVRVTNGPAGTAPSYFFTAGSDTLTGPVAEYQLCFKCHSSWTRQPAGQTDLALALNPANPSYHPVEAAGQNPTVDLRAFVNGWQPTSLTRCDDCHGSDSDLTSGPHGSIYRYILRRPAVASPTPRATQSDELCFLCHSYDVYASSAAGPDVKAYSRFAAHATHVDSLQVPCYSCHVTHGTADAPHLVATGRVPGLLSYTETPGGGTCTPAGGGCHGSRSYTVSYAR